VLVCIDFDLKTRVCVIELIDSVERGLSLNCYVIR